MSTPAIVTPTLPATAALVAQRLAERHGEFAVVGLGRSGEAVTRLLTRYGVRVYASDRGDTPALQQSANALRADGVSVDLGVHDLARVARAVVVVASPGVPPGAPPLAAARAAGVPVVSEVEIALRLQPGLRYIAVTGTNGKTTTTALIGHLLRALGLQAVDAGNIGTPVSAIIDRTPPAQWASLELSSFQLHDTPGVFPDVGVLTTLSPDHLDRYPSVDAYYADKALLFANASANSRWVVNGDNARVMQMVQGVSGTITTFSTQARGHTAWYDRTHDALVVREQLLLARRELALAGDHNVANALAASLAVMLASPEFETPDARRRLADGLRSFRALAHRLEPVADEGGVLWLNDSKATNVASTLVALEGMTRPTVLLLGGRHKGEPYTGLVPSLLRLARAVIVYGEAAPIILRDLTEPLRGRVPLIDATGRAFVDVVTRARDAARRGDVVLLSPACSSYDMFTDYEDRGRQFTALARHGAARPEASTRPVERA